MTSIEPAELPSLSTTTASTSTNNSMPASPGSASTTVVDGKEEEPKIAVEDLVEDMKVDAGDNPEVCSFFPQAMRWDSVSCVVSRQPLTYFVLLPLFPP